MKKKPHLVYDQLHAFEQQHVYSQCAVPLLASVCRESGTAFKMAPSQCFHDLLNESPKEKSHAV